MTLRAWRTEAIGIVSIVSARSRSKAKYRTYRSARNADWDVSITEVVAKRAPEYDLWAQQAEERVVTREHAGRRVRELTEERDG